MKMKNEDTLCNTHLLIIGNLKQLKKMLKQGARANDINNVDTMLNSINVCIKSLKQARKQGEAMEKRLRKYHNTIASLGFERMR